VKEFANLYTALDETNKTNEKVRAMQSYFVNATAADAAWAIYFLIGRKPKAVVQMPKLASWAIEEADIEPWLFDESYDSVGDLAETISLLLPEGLSATDLSLTEWVEERLLKLKGLPDEEQKRRMLAYWQELSTNQKYIWNKLLTGAFRVGVSQQLVMRALSLVSSVDPAVIAHRLMGNWEPAPEFYESLISTDTEDADQSKPYPFYLAYPLQDEPENLGDISEWQIEWKWDGIRSQVIRRKEQTFIWSRGEELVTDRYPELIEAAENLPNGTVLDGEILPWKNERPLPFVQLQQRIGRKLTSAKLLEEVPVILMVYDLLELDGKDIRSESLERRRALLAELIEKSAVSQSLVSQSDLSHSAEVQSVDPQSLVSAKIKAPLQLKLFSKQEKAKVRTDENTLRISPTVGAESWQHLHTKLESVRDLQVEGFMLKRLSSTYKVGRQRGDWWKWKVDPFTIDAVLIYAQKGSGKRANLYTDYTFGVWDEGKLVPIAKAYSGLTDQEIIQVDSFVRQNTIEKFGPVRTVKPQLVFELGFEAIQRSKRHKSGIAVRFPRMLRWRRDKPVDEADSLLSIINMLPDSAIESG